MDFLTRNAESQSFQESKLVLCPRELGLDPEEIPLFPLSTLQKDAACLPAPLVTAAREVLAPRTGAHIRVKLPGTSALPNGAPVYIERIADALPAHLFIGNSVANVEDRELTLNIVNVSGRYAQILRGAPLAIATLCEVITEEDEGAEEQALPPPFVSATTSAAASGGSTQGSTLHAPSMSASGQMELKGGETGGQNPAARPDELTEEEKEKAEAEIDKALEDCEHLSAKQKKELKDLLLEYRDLFPTDRNPGNIKGVEARVDVETDTPIYERPRPVPHALRAELREGLQKLLEGGIIKPTSSPWGFLLVFIRKKTGKLKICIDYRKLNKILRKDRWPLLRIDHTLAKLQGRRFYTLINLFQGFHHVSVREDHQERLSFVTADGQFTYCKMPFSILTAPSIFQRAMDIMLAGLTGSFVNVYLDDILVASFSFEEHLTHICKTLDRLRTSGYKLSFAKCLWAQTSLLYLGHIVDTTGIRPNPKKVETILSISAPTDKKQMKQLLGLASFYRRFIKGFSQIVFPLTSLLRKHTPFVWEEPQRRAFEALKEALTSEPVLCRPDFDKEFVVKPDASNDAIGAVLGQTDEERNEKVVAYASKMMTDLEKKWGIIEREALSLVYTVDTFKPYLYGKKFIVITDHKALQHIHDQKDSQPRVMRWALKLAIYKFDVQHRSEAKHADADSMTRPPVAGTGASLEVPSLKRKRDRDTDSDEEDEIVVAPCSTGGAAVEIDGSDRKHELNMSTDSEVEIISVLSPGKATVHCKGSKDRAVRPQSLHPLRVAAGKRGRPRKDNSMNSCNAKKVMKDPKPSKGWRRPTGPGRPRSGPKAAPPSPSLSAPLCIGNYSIEEFKRL
uniref:Reverse transcriptase domain-containing protein n=1 Tax=Chromera velia CCMP2878 TaxID=1169474 RepID=A0A0G4G2C5_9ALVE|eukprot:Cvel_19933.t1-p1 / transcript=Cvel_19933.t1 / gene=Cvel_19933 / organism=Chromera_velia_CCMP2878 / gene_product=Retrovirus-related Pol polyprotein from transposon, putative / transcript_product=Retrovirus-related Pol polyprotein from transposon, putative / location=Cvel_scaffold1754:11650-14196(+) / protein_length=849 / sequence_SO=supercontig / SO=protein_coding / is_pseudo=false